MFCDSCGKFLARCYLTRQSIYLESRRLDSSSSLDNPELRSSCRELQNVNRADWLLARMRVRWVEMIEGERRSEYSMREDDMNVFGPIISAAVPSLVREMANLIG